MVNITIKYSWYKERQTVLGLYVTPGTQTSQCTLYTVSSLPPKKWGACHDRVTVDWSTKLTVKLFGADGGSEKKMVYTLNYLKLLKRFNKTGNS